MTDSTDSFEAQVLAILGPLHGVARRLTKNEADAEDLVAESVTRAILIDDADGKAEAVRRKFRVTGTLEQL